MKFLSKLIGFREKLKSKGCRSLSQKTSRGTALIIVLVMVVLLTILIVAYLANSTSDRRLSNSSLNQTIVDQLAHSASDIIIGDLKQEIFNSGYNTITTVGPSGAQTTISMPLINGSSNTYSGMLPTRSGNPALTAKGVDPIPNLIRISIRSDPISAPGVASRASAASSQNTSLNGRSVSPKRWNAHFLIPLQNSGSTAISSTAPDSTPIASFTVPDWVFVTSDKGPTVITKPGSTVIGRYAYAIYDEGGLLDINVAGSPSTITSTLAANKSSLALIDLTKLLNTSGTQLIPTAAADALVGWRNYASLQSNFQKGGSDSINGSFPGGFSFNVNNATDFFYNFGRGSSSAYLKANNLASNNNLTDQLFLSRQQLISMQATLQQSVGFSPSALQYLTTFSRGLDQPSFSPDPNRHITASYSGDPAKADPQDSNSSNTASGNDNYINPSFLTVRAMSTVPGGRNDGSDITIGEPLVKKRFALNRLAWLTYKGPIADGNTPLSTVATTASMVNSTDSDLTKMAQYLHDNYGLSYAFLQEGTAANVYNYFGLSWVTDNRTTPQGNGQKKWFYNHSRSNSAGYFSSLPTSSSSFGPILRVGRPASDTTPDSTRYVQDLSTPREPDFFELLKAAIVAGSKGKVATLEIPFTGVDGKTLFNSQPNPDDFQNRMDSSLEFQIIQIGANIIQQSRLDGYPTQILYNDGSIVATREFSGAENLPYFYGVRTGMVQGKAPVISNPPVPDVAAPYNGYKTTPAKIPTLTDTGYTVAMLFPIVWNPNDQNSPRCALDSSGKFLTDASGKPLFPTSFRIVADSTDPDDISSSGTSNYGTIKMTPFNSYTYDNGTSTKKPDTVKTYATSANTPICPPFTTGTQLDNSSSFKLTAESTALTFTIDESTYPSAQSFFHEPTYLISPNVPANSSLKAGGSTNCLNPKASGTLYPPITEFPNLQSNAYMDTTSGALLTTDTTNAQVCLNLSPLLGFYLGTYPGAYYWDVTQPGDTITPLANFPSKTYQFTDTLNTQKTLSSFQMVAVPDQCVVASTSPVTYRMQYETTPGSGVWVTYDSKYVSSIASPNIGLTDYSNSAYVSGTALGTRAHCTGYDPRTSRFSMPFQYVSSADAPPGMSNISNYSTTTSASKPGTPWTTTTSSTFGWLNNITSRVNGSQVVNNEIMTERPDIALGFYMGFSSGGASGADAQFPEAYGWNFGNGNGLYPTFFGLFQINSPTYTPTSAYKTYETCQSAASAPNIPSTKTVINSTYLPTGPSYYMDPDCVVRRGMGAYFTDNSGTVSTTTTPGVYPGLPMATASTISSSGANLAAAQAQSRPVILHRPFRSVAELGYVFSGTPWKNLDFFTPESGDAPLLDVFCIDDSDNSEGIVAGKINLNTRQAPVLQAVLTGAYKDEQASYTGNYNPSISAYASPNYSPLSSLSGSTSATEAGLIANALITRTTGIGLGKGPLVNVSDLVGRYVSGYTNAYGQPYDGFSSDLGASVFTTSTTQSAQIQRFREAPIRVLSAVGQTRVWNLLIDVIAQKGRFPSTATTLDNFYVEGEQRYWVHVAIDRFTGQVIDKQIEVVNE